MNKILPFTFGVVFVMVGLFGAYIPSAKAVTYNVPADYLTIQAAIDAADTGDEIIVAKGTYKENINFKGKAITVRSAGPDDPNVVKDTIIDGNGSGSVVTFNNGEDLNAVLSGFTIQNGSHDHGGGMQFYLSSSPSITYCTISGNSAKYGGGILCSSSSPSINNCTVSGNSATQHGGGGVSCYCSSPCISNCTISSNSAAEDGGGIFCRGDSSSPNISNCTIKGNSSAEDGGGVYCYSASPIISNCNISSNSAQSGGGVFYHHSSSPSISYCTIIGNAATNGAGLYCKDDYSLSSINNCTITENSAAGNGGGLFCYSSLPGISNCTISSNSAHDGGGVFCIYSSPNISNCRINNNFAAEDGGGVCCCNSSPSISNCTISSNFSANGGAMFCDRTSAYITNSIIWNNSTGIFASSSSHPRLSFCNVQGGYTGLGNINADPLYVDPINDDYHLQAGSPCSDAGHPRIYDSDTSRSDMGRFGGGGGCESNSITITVDLNGNGDFSSIQDAIDYALTGDTISVLQGIYKENLVIVGKDIVCISSSGKNSTIIDGSEAGSVIFLSRIEHRTLIEGFTIQNGSGPGDGGGVHCYYSSPTISNCTISCNSADYGGGVFCYFYSSPSISYCTITGNAGQGGGVCCYKYSSPGISNCTISDNSADYDGGGMCCFYYSSPNISNCAIIGNSADQHGGGVWCWLHSSPSISNCTISDNYAEDGGGVYIETASSPNITNCTITGNFATGKGGGMYCYDYSSSPYLINSILWDNGLEVYIEEKKSRANPQLRYCNVQGGYTGLGNIDADPLFVDAENGDYHLLPGSPCIDAGANNEDLPDIEIPSTDKDGVTRPQDGNEDGIAGCDIGAYELYVNHNPILTPTGNKTIKEGTLLQFIISATDPDGDALHYSAIDLPSGAGFDPSTQVFSFRPSRTQSGSYQISFIVSDDGMPSLSDSETITITVKNRRSISSVYSPIASLYQPYWGDVVNSYLEWWPPQTSWNQFMLWGNQSWAYLGYKNWYLGYLNSYLLYLY